MSQQGSGIPQQAPEGGLESPYDDLLDDAPAAAPGERHEKAREMFLGKINITDGKEISYCEWNVVGAGETWTYSAFMRLKNGTHHRIVVGYDQRGAFVREAQAGSKEDAIVAVKARILAFLKRQPRWRVVD